ncbi:MAG: heparinase II/III-family protein [Actinobacteria bacterium]|nr:heparinase II/III-family protein [Actinomycetota bacterium]MCG2817470.1 heparinase II/III-family protein [Actinomycetes bacterium]MBU4217953.1 heparinase II/III-family protein [Actinomycetota bacterium]MBU4357933.1 heparinase II/III-family protein [Actinomycetota bacterium]MBU4393016.1 heparinase II/III-family protein [Actinomycetota bacterium]
MDKFTNSILKVARRLSIPDRFDFSSFILLLIAGSIGGTLSFLLNSTILRRFSEANNLNPYYLVLFGVLVGLFCFPFLPSVSAEKERFRTRKSMFLLAITATAATALLLLAIYLLGESLWISSLLLPMLFAVCICSGYVLLANITSIRLLNLPLATSGAVAGGLVAAILSALLLNLRMHFSIDEGYLFLYSILLCAPGIILGVVVSLFVQVRDLLAGNKSRSRSPGILWPRAIFLLLAMVLVACVVTVYLFSYWHTLGIGSTGEEGQMFFIEPTPLSTEASDAPTRDVYDREKIVSLLRDQSETIDTLTTIYILSGEEEAGRKARDILVQAAQDDKYCDLAKATKNWQYDATTFVYNYLLLNEKDPELFSESDRNQILAWFKMLNENAFVKNWGDYVYAVLFKKKPSGIYENQEIGIGLLAVLAEALESKYPELARKDKDYVERHGVGWTNNFRNTDDAITYHHSIWVKNAYMMYEYGCEDKDNAVIRDNARNSFEWILAQWPPNGMNPTYNSYSSYMPIDDMAIGAYLFKDGRYKWLSERMIESQIEYEGPDFDSTKGLHLWDDTITSQTPQIGSCLLFGTTGTASKPGALKPDKVVLRDGWKQDSLYSLLNLRFSGWHSYKATNSIISIMSGEPFVVEKLEERIHSWLPTANASTRDRKIYREWLNCFQIELSGYEKLVRYLTGFGSEWSQDPPRFAEIVYFDKDDSLSMDISITRINKWHGWNHTRTMVLVRDKYLAVLDQADGNDKRRSALAWHLHGDITEDDSSFLLDQGADKLNFFLPRNTGWYQVDSNKREPVDDGKDIEVHKSDMDVFLESSGRDSVGFIGVFQPVREGNDIKVACVQVTDEHGKEAYPGAIGVEVTEPGCRVMICSSTKNALFSYGGELQSNAGFIIYEMRDSDTSIKFDGGDVFIIEKTEKPDCIVFGSTELLEGEDWTYSGDTLRISTPGDEGCLEIN